MNLRERVAMSLSGLEYSGGSMDESSKLSGAEPANSLINMKVDSHDGIAFI